MPDAPDVDKVIDIFIDMSYKVYLKQLKLKYTDRWPYTTKKQHNI